MAVSDKTIQKVVEEMQDLDYDVTPEKVRELLEWHKANPMPDNAALASNILVSLETKGVKTSP